MAFESGSVSFVMCKLSGELPEDAIAKFAEKRAYSLETVLDEPQIGWVGRKLLDTRIDENIAFLGGHLYLNLRSAVRKIPATLLRAEMQLEELALMQELKTPKLSRKQKKEIKEEVSERLLKTMPPTLTATSFVFDQTAETVYIGATSQAQIDQFLFFFLETLGTEPLQLTSESTIESIFSTDLHSLPSLRFSESSPYDNEMACLPGRDFMTWLWYFGEMESGVFEVEGLGEFSVMVDGPLVFSADEEGGLEAVIRKGLPTISSEAKAALASGKKLKRAKVMLVRNEEIWNFTIDADNFVFRGMTLPAVEKNLDPTSHFSERIKLLRIFRKAFFALFERYLNLAKDASLLETKSKEFHNWIQNLERESEVGVE